MTKRLVILGALVFTVATILISIFIVQPAKPIIDIKGEKLVTVVEHDNDILNFAITNTLFTAWVAMALLLLICVIALRGKALVPSGFYNFFEALIEAILNFVISIAGERNGRRFFPVVATFFIYITFANWLSLTPLFNTVGIFEPLHAEEAEFHERAVVFKESGGVSLILPGAKDIEVAPLDPETGQLCLAGNAGDECRELAIEEATHDKVDAEADEAAGILAPYLRGINTDLMTPLSFALVSAFFVEWWGISTLGVFRYVTKFVNFRSPLDFFVGLLEFVAEVARLISFSFRLFGNMLAGEILLLVMTFLVAVSTPVLLFFYGLELFVGAIQAFVFGTLTLVFAVLAVSAHSAEDHQEEPQH